jgi:hypothetical protein
MEHIARFFFGVSGECHGASCEFPHESFSGFVLMSLGCVWFSGNVTALFLFLSPV